MTAVAAPPVDLNRMAATDLADLIRDGSVSARQATEAALASIAAQDDHLHAFVTVDADSARDQADRLDIKASHGEYAGPLHGVPFAVKDLISTVGMRTTRGSLLHEHDVPVEDDLIVTRLRAAGAVLIGKTNTP